MHRAQDKEFARRVVELVSEVAAPRPEGRLSWYPPNVFEQRRGGCLKALPDTVALLVGGKVGLMKSPQAQEPRKRLVVRPHREMRTAIR